jgi:hypothetical protein
MSKKLPPVRSENDIIEAEGDLLTSALAIVKKGQERIYERIDDMSDQQLVAATQMATRTVSTKRRWQYGSTGGDGVGMKALVDKLASMPNGSKVTLTAKVEAQAENDAIDVTSRSRRVKARSKRDVSRDAD